MDKYKCGIVHVLFCFSHHCGITNKSVLIYPYQLILTFILKGPSSCFCRYLFTVTSRSCHCFYVENFLVHFTNTPVYLAVTLFSQPHSLLLQQTVVGLVLVKKIKRNDFNGICCFILFPPLVINQLALYFMSAFISVCTVLPFNTFNPWEPWGLLF